MIKFISELSADAEAAKKFIVKFREIVEQYELLPCQVYNIDETGLNYKVLPKKNTRFIKWYRGKNETYKI